MSASKKKKAAPKQQRKLRDKAEPIPAALAFWGYSDWPALVYPHREGAARHLAQVHRDSLLRAGVLSRVGREVVWNGLRYAKWIERQAWHEIEMPGADV